MKTIFEKDIRYTSYLCSCGKHKYCCTNAGARSIVAIIMHGMLTYLLSFIISCVVIRIIASYKCDAFMTNTWEDFVLVSTTTTLSSLLLYWLLCAPYPD